MPKGKFGMERRGAKGEITLVPVIHNNVGSAVQARNELDDLESIFSDSRLESDIETETEVEVQSIDYEYEYHEQPIKMYTMYLKIHTGEDRLSTDLWDSEVSQTSAVLDMLCGKMSSVNIEIDSDDNIRKGCPIVGLTFETETSGMFDVVDRFAVSSPIVLRYTFGPNAVPSSGEIQIIRDFFKNEFESIEPYDIKVEYTTRDIVVTLNEDRMSHNMISVVTKNFNNLVKEQAPNVSMMYDWPILEAA